MRTRTRRIASVTGGLALGLSGLLAAGCDKVPLTAPASSTVTVTANAKTLPVGGSAQITAFVAEQAGTPVQNGTTVHFTTTLGRVDPADVQTKDGSATTTFYAGDVSGTASIRATSGSIGGTTSSGTGTTTTATNGVDILVGTAAVATVVVRSSAGSVPATGGTVIVVATVMNDGGGLIPGVPVSFSTTAGSLSSSRETTDGNGEAQTRLTTDANATVTAAAGTKTGTVAIQALNPVTTPTITLAATSASATSAAQLWTLTATVANNAAYGSPLKFQWAFGDGTTTETNGPSITHAYTQELTVYTATVTAVFSNGFSVSASTQIATADFP